MADKQLIQCPLCGDQVDTLVFRFHHESEQEIINRIKNDHREWVEHEGLCSRCLDYYHTEIVIQHRILPEIGPHFSIKSVDDFIILPTSLRLNTDPHYTGKGITICFIDSGFYLHDDLIKTKNRIKCIVDITDKKRALEYFQEAHAESWHGTMTSVVCAGDGYSSNGLYKGIANDANLVLLKVQTTNSEDQDNGRITSENLIGALQWVLDHHIEFDIRIVSISVSDDFPLATKDSKVSQLAENLIEEGIVVIAAAGNDLNSQIKPPASSPNAITVGGLDDRNRLDDSDKELYHSTFGQTLDGLMKPELIAQAIWIAAPILPGTKEKREAEMLHKLVALNEDQLITFLHENKNSISKDTELNLGPDNSETCNRFKQEIIERIQRTKFISASYMHVDGTSFATPIVSSIVAQLLECNPDLTPSDIRSILFSTAKRLPNFEATRQGYGAINPRKAIVQALRRERIEIPSSSPFVNRENGQIEFYVHHDGAYQITLCGTFNGWAKGTLFFAPSKHGLWKIKIPMLPNGKYHYKFLIDQAYWVEDVKNPLREPDSYNGFNSILVVS